MKNNFGWCGGLGGQAITQLKEHEPSGSHRNQAITQSKEHEPSGSHRNQSITQSKEHEPSGRHRNQMMSREHPFFYCFFFGKERCYVLSLPDLPKISPTCAVSEEGAEQRGVRSVQEFSQVFQDLLRRFFRYFYYIRFRIYYTVSVV